MRNQNRAVSYSVPEAEAPCLSGLGALHDSGREDIRFARLGTWQITIAGEDEVQTKKDLTPFLLFSGAECP